MLREITLECCTVLTVAAVVVAAAVAAAAVADACVFTNSKFVCVRPGTRRLK